jgi:hypothetical protein
MGGRAAAWAFAAASTFGPFVSWSTALYQEGTFLLIFYAGLWLALSGRLVLGDLVMGGLALVRYEGWPCLLLYLAWRRDPRAALALWGAALWVALKAGVHVEGFRASAADFDDWVGIRERFAWDTWLHDAYGLLKLAVLTGAVGLTCAGALGAWFGRRDRVPGTLLVAAVTLSQLAAIAGWLVGLEVATNRMLVIPVMLATILGALAFGRIWAAARRRWIRVALVAGLVAQIATGPTEARDAAVGETRNVGPERAALAKMAEKSSGKWCVTPRTGLGTRSRHDGCEVMQGISELRHGRDFVCRPWIEHMPWIPASADDCVGEVVWRSGSYGVWLESEPPDLPPADPDGAAADGPVTDSPDPGTPVVIRP